VLGPRSAFAPDPLGDAQPLEPHRAGLSLARAAPDHGAGGRAAARIAFGRLGRKMSKFLGAKDEFIC